MTYEHKLCALARKCTFHKEISKGNLALLCPLNYTAFSLCACCEDYENNFMGGVIPKGPLVSWQPPVKQSRRLGVVLCR